MKAGPLVLFALAAVAGLPATAAAAGAGPYVPQAIGAEVRDPVCGMYPARYAGWRSEIVFRDKSIAAFDSPLHMFRFRQRQGRYDARHKAADIAAIYVSDYIEQRWIDSATAFFVVGSRVRSPMNAEGLPAFGSREAGERFAREQGGKVLSFDQITPSFLASLPDDGAAHSAIKGM